MEKGIFVRVYGSVLNSRWFTCEGNLIKLNYACSNYNIIVFFGVDQKKSDRNNIYV